MRSIGRSADDMTGHAAADNVAGGVVVNAVLASLHDELDQVLVLAHLALGMPLAPLARDLQMGRLELQARVDRILAAFGNSDLKARLAGIERAGQIEHYSPIIARLGLQNWFCARPGCTNLISQSKTGRPRKTCSGRCRSQMYRAGAVERHSDESQPQPGAPVSEEPEAATAVRTFILQVMQPINYPPPLGYWDKANIHCRDRALLLLAFTGLVPVTVLDLCDLDVGDVGKSAAGLEIRLYKKRQSRSTQYLTIPASDDPRLCVAQALLSWRRVLARNGRTTGPLFTRLGSSGNFPKNDHRVSRDTVTALIWKALESWGADRWRDKQFKFGESRPLSDFLQEVTSDGDLRRAVSRLGPVKDGPLKDDPCWGRTLRLYPRIETGSRSA